MEETNINRIKRLQESRKSLMDRVVNIVKHDPWVPIELGGKEYRLEYSFGAVSDVYRQTGINLQSGETIDLSKPDNIVLMLQAGLRTHHADIFNGEEGKEALRYMMNFRFMVYYSAMINYALEAIQPDIDDITRVLGEDITKLNGVDKGEEQLPLQLVDRPF